MKYFLFVFIFSLATCSAQAQIKEKPVDAYNKKKIAPDNCLVQAKILKVVPAWRKKSKKSCKASPCLAYIKIIKVEKYGSAFPMHFSVGEKIEVCFIFSLKPSKKVYLDKHLKLPGLKKGDEFKAQINAKPKFGSNLSDFKIYGYELK